MSDLLGSSLRQPPTNTMAEQALLGAIMANNAAFSRVGSFLKPEHFADPVNGRIYKEAGRRVLAGEIADLITMRASFAADPEIDEVGGIDYLTHLQVAMVGIINAKDYGLAIFECWQRRALIEIGTDLVNRSFEAISDNAPTPLITKVIDDLDAITNGASDVRKAVSMDDAVGAVLDAYDKAIKHGGTVGVSTGMPSVDNAIGGLEPQSYTVLAARPGMGKTALALGWGLHAAREAKAAINRGEPKRGVLFVSLEMSAEQLGRRAIAAAADLPVEAIKRARLSQRDVDRMILAQKELRGLPLSIEDGAGLSIGMIRLKMRAAKRRHGLGLVILDHLHIIRPEDVDVRNGSTAAIGRISNSLKRLAKEFDVPVLCLAQLNRAVESRDDKRPNLADLRQAGEIEQDADCVAFIYRGEYYLSKGEPERYPSETPEKFATRIAADHDAKENLYGKAELILAKVRDGAPCTVPLLFDGPTTSFSEACQ